MLGRKVAVTAHLHRINRATVVSRRGVLGTLRRQCRHRLPAVTSSTGQRWRSSGTTATKPPALNSGNAEPVVENAEHADAEFSAGNGWDGEAGDVKAASPEHEDKAISTSSGGDGGAMTPKEYRAKMEAAGYVMHRKRNLATTPRDEAEMLEQGAGDGAVGKVLRNAEDGPRGNATYVETDEQHARLERVMMALAGLSFCIWVVISFGDIQRAVVRNPSDIACRYSLQLHCIARCAVCTKFLTYLACRPGGFSGAEAGCIYDPPAAAAHNGGGKRARYAQ